MCIGVHTHSCSARRTQARPRGLLVSRRTRRRGHPHNLRRHDLHSATLCVYIFILYAIYIKYIAWSSIIIVRQLWNEIGGQYHNTIIFPAPLSLRQFQGALIWSKLMKIKVPFIPFRYWNGIINGTLISFSRLQTPLITVWRTLKVCRFPYYFSFTIKLYQCR